MAARMILLVLAALLTAPLAAASLPDPTALPTSLSSAPSGTTAEAAGLAWVRVNGRQSVAWYGGTTVKVGDSVDGGQVTAIREDHIVISGKGGRRTVHLLDHTIRTQSRAQSPAR